MNGNPTNAQKDFHEWARNLGCIVSLSNADCIHHIGGSKMKLKGVNKPGEWFILPLSYWWHQDGNNKAALHVNKSLFKRTVFATEKDLWLKLMHLYSLEFYCYPMSDEEYQIMKDRA